MLARVADDDLGDTHAERDPQRQFFVCLARGGQLRRLARLHAATGGNAVAHAAALTFDRRERVVVYDHDAGATGATGGQYLRPEWA